MTKGNWKTTNFWSRYWYFRSCFLVASQCLTWMNIHAHIREGGSRCWWYYSTSHVTSHLLTKSLHGHGIMIFGFLFFGIHQIVFHLVSTYYIQKWSKSVNVGIQQVQSTLNMINIVGICHRAYVQCDSRFTPSHMKIACKASYTWLYSYIQYVLILSNLVVGKSMKNNWVHANSKSIDSLPKSKNH